MGHGRYILKGKEVVKCDDLNEWEEFLKNEDRRVAVSTGNGFDISTVFLGLGHSYREGDRPLIFETMAFGGVPDGKSDLYRTWDEAEAGHVRMAEKLFGLTGVLVIWKEEAI